MDSQERSAADWSECSEVEFWPMAGREICILRGTTYHPDIIVNTYLQGDSLQTIARRFEDWTPEQVRLVLDYAQVRKPELFLGERVEKFDWSGCSEV